MKQKKSRKQKKRTRGGAWYKSDLGKRPKKGRNRAAGSKKRRKRTSKRIF